MALTEISRPSNTPSDPLSERLHNHVERLQVALKTVKQILPDEDDKNTAAEDPQGTNACMFQAAVLVEELITCLDKLQGFIGRL